MGNCGGTAGSAMSVEEKQAHQTIEHELRVGKKAMNTETKLLMLGTGESGKTTIVRQMKIIHQAGFTEAERVAFHDTIHSNIFASVRFLVEFYLHEDPIRLSAETHKAAEAIVSDMDCILTKERVDQIRIILEDPLVKDRLAKKLISDTAGYFFANMERMVGSFIPTDEDILHARIRTTGIKELRFEMKGNPFRVIDVGGQRSERKKWIHCFQDVRAVIFCISLNDYDMKLFEDELVNRMKESLVLWEEVGNSKWFANVPIIVFFNKSDLFAEKIKHVDIIDCFPEYTGGCDHDKALKYIMGQFMALTMRRKDKIYSHVTCAMDSNCMRKVFDNVQEIIVKESLSAQQF